METEAQIFYFPVILDVLLIQSFNNYKDLNGDFVLFQTSLFRLGGLQQCANTRVEYSGRSAPFWYTTITT